MDRKKTHKKRADRKKKWRLASLPLSTKPLLILDVNGILAAFVENPLLHDNKLTIVSGKSVFKRPHCDDFLQFCFEKFHVGVWSSRQRHNLTQVLDAIMGDLTNRLLFVWDQTSCTCINNTNLERDKKPLFLKELKKIWVEEWTLIPPVKFNESNTLLLDDSPPKAICNPENTAIFPISYLYTNENDDSLGPGGEIRDYLEKLVSSDNIQEYVKQNPFNDRCIKKTDDYYYLYKEVLDSLDLRTGATTKKREMPEAAYQDEEAYQKYKRKAEQRKSDKIKRKERTNECL